MDSKQKIKIIFFYSEVVGYVIGLLRTILKLNPQISIIIVYIERKSANRSRYELPQIDGVEFIPRASLDNAALLNLLKGFAPDIVYVSGWHDKGYLSTLRRYRKAGNKVPVVCGIDDRWKGTLRQYLGIVYFKLFYRKIFDFMWIAGKPQFSYAQRFGYNSESIIFNLYSADDEVFNKKAEFSRRFVFVGRFDPVKALDLLVDAYLKLPESIQEKWPLVLIGDGELRAEIERRKTENIIIKPFMQPAELMDELMQGGVSCMPSYSDQWGVAIHEMAILGYPFILSSGCGAATEFLISDYNGFLFKTGSEESLYNALLKIAQLNDDELKLFADRSHFLSSRINPEQAAYSLLSVIYLSETQ